MKQKLLDIYSFIFMLGNCPSWIPW